MTKVGWDTLILSEPNYDHLVAEIHHDGQFLLQLDREQGRSSICISFPDRDGNLGSRILLSEFMEELRKAVDDLKR